MCLIAWNWQPASPTPLLLIANRDEYHARPTAPLHRWDDDANIVAGRDLQAGGTWLGVGLNGRLAALTNYRDLAHMRPDAPSRGELVSAFLKSEASAVDYLSELAPRTAPYNPFNLLVYDGTQLLGLESRHAKVVTMPTGVCAVSNADFDTPWPKLTTLKTGFQQLIDQDAIDDSHLMALLQNPNIAPDTDLPHTGLPLPAERALSAAFVTLPDYGTRACSVVRIGVTGKRFTEQSFGHNGYLQTHRLDF